MPSPELQKPEDIDTKSIISMQELDPSPVEDTPGFENGEYFPRTEPTTQNGAGFPKVGLSGHRWDTWCKSNNPSNSTTSNKSQ
jgi:hypothetical protein